MTGGEALARQLELEGVRDVFGVPGVQLDHALDGIARAGRSITFRNTRHEQAASYMADGYARTTGEVGVCMVVPGPGLLNAAAGLATAYACSSPVLAVVGQLPSAAVGRNLGLLHEIPDQSHTLGTLTKWQGFARSPAEIPALVREAFHHLRSGRPRPVGIEIPPDVLGARADVALHPSAPAERVPPDPDRLDAAAALLRTAQRPVIYVGWGVQAAGAGEKLRRLAELLGAPVVMSRNGRGSLSARHPLALSHLGGRRVLADADVVLVVGSRFLTNSGTAVPVAPAARMIHVNADPADLGPPRSPEVAVHGDAGQALEALHERLDGRPPGPSRHAELVAVRDWCDRQAAAVEPQYSWVRALREGIPEDGILVNELTQVGYLAMVAYPVLEPRTYLTPGYQGTLGYGFPTALGAKIAHPDRVVVSITGDGGFGWNLQELATARKYGIAVTTVVFDDGAFGNVARIQREQFGGRELGTELDNPDFVALAESFGVPAETVRSPDELAAALKRAGAGREPVVLHVPVGEMPSPWHLLVDPPTP